MTNIRTTNPYHSEDYESKLSLEVLKQRYEEEIYNYGFFTFRDTKGHFVTINPKQLASVDMWEV